VRIIDNEITNDFWDITAPNKLLVSSSKNNALRNAFFACLIRSGAPVLFSTRKVSDLFDPSLKQKRKSLEKHHLFPRNFLLTEFDLCGTLGEIGETGMPVEAHLVWGEAAAPSPAAILGTLPRGAQSPGQAEPAPLPLAESRGKWG
jgi:hypothetical protein